MMPAREIVSALLLLAALSACGDSHEPAHTSGGDSEFEALPTRIFHGSSGIVLIRVERGRYTMGSPSWEEGRDGDEEQVEVEVAEPFWLAETEITVGQWRAVMGTELPLEQDDDELPVKGVTWYAAQEFLRRLNSNGTGGWRLPTEIEWEYACRAGTRTIFSFGDELSPELASYDGRKPYAEGERAPYRDDVVRVRSFAPNPWGFYDMHGNLWEWCADLYVIYPGASRLPEDPEGASRSIRGGAFTSKGAQLRSAYRDGHPPSSSGENYGFRVARSGP
jgi:sulfatase modifying factor 1